MMAGRPVRPTTGNANEMAPTAKTDEAEAKLDATWVDVISGSEVQREREPTGLLRVSGLIEPGDLGVMSYWLGGLAYTAIAMASGVWLTVDWTMIDNEEPFDNIEAAERHWIAIQLPIPVDPALDAQVLHRVTRILRALAAMDMPDGLTVEGPRAPDGFGELVRARVAPPWETHEWDGESAPCEIYCVRSAGGGLAGVARADRRAGGDSAVGPAEQGESHHRAHDAPVETTAARDWLRALHAGDGHARR